MKRHFWSLSPEELEDFVISKNEKKFRKSQILDWVYKKYCIKPELMTNIPKALLNNIVYDFDFELPKVAKLFNSNDNTQKFLLLLSDLEKVEMVTIPTKKKNTLCVSSQVGCKFGCIFCATASLGFRRNLTSEEIISQVYLAGQKLFSEEEKINNLVFMGMGEPLDNVKNLMDSIKKLQNSETFSISPRRMTVSTCGFLPGLQDLMNSGLKVKLAISLNSATQEKRNMIMPVNKIYSLEKLKKALINFQKVNPFRITIEYIMFKKWNMFDTDVRELEKFVRGLSCKINLIPWNPTYDMENKNQNFCLQPPNEKEINDFIQKLLHFKAPITLRRSKGQDISAACGQLAARGL